MFEEIKSVGGDLVFDTEELAKSGMVGIEQLKLAIDAIE